MTPTAGHNLSAPGAREACGIVVGGRCASGVQPSSSNASLHPEKQMPGTESFLRTGKSRGREGRALSGSHCRQVLGLGSPLRLSDWLVWRSGFLSGGLAPCQLRGMLRFPFLMKFKQPWPSVLARVSFLGFLSPRSGLVSMAPASPDAGGQKREPRARGRHEGVSHAPHGGGLPRPARRGRSPL